MLIILTTTVFVQNKLYLFQTDPQERINTYILSINKWLNQTNFNIIVVDNSEYPFKEIEENDRLQIISYEEKMVTDSLLNNQSKGASELFAINYAFNRSKFICSFIIKITGRYFIPKFEEYLNYIFSFNKPDAICQNGSRCEMIGCKKEFFNKLFNISLILNDNTYCNHIEDLYNERLNTFKSLLICKKLFIFPIKHGGIDQICNYL